MRKILSVFLWPPCAHPVILITHRETHTTEKKARMCGAGSGFEVSAYICYQLSSHPTVLLSSIADSLSSTELDPARLCPVITLSLLTQKDRHKDGIGGYEIP